VTITTDANELVAEIHDRRSHATDYARWLSDEPDPRDLMRPFPAEPMRIWPISTRINRGPPSGQRSGQPAVCWIRPRAVLVTRATGLTHPKLIDERTYRRRDFRGVLTQSSHRVCLLERCGGRKLEAASVGTIAASVITDWRA
jgi:hypothetical protein